MNNKKPTAAERIQALTEGDKPAVVEIPKNQNEEGGKIDKRKFNKRHPNSGRKPKEITLIERGIKQWVDEHINEEVEITVISNGVARTIKKPRVAVVLEKLYVIGMKGDGNPDALNKWLDRALGKPYQTIGGDADKPITLKIDF